MTATAAKRLRGGTVCSGIGGAELAAPAVDWRFCAEIERFPSAVLAHRFPGVPNRGNMTKWRQWPDDEIDILCGGTPCQSFSTAGERGGLADPRGNLAYEFAEMAGTLRPRWLVWENVPGVLSSDEGRDFGDFVWALVERGFCVAWRVLDACHVRTNRFPRSLPQRRKRVWLVGCLGPDPGRPASILFEREGLRGHPSPGGAGGVGPDTEGLPLFAGAAGRDDDGAGRGDRADDRGGRVRDVAPTLTAAHNPAHRRGVNDAIVSGDRLAANVDERQVAYTLTTTSGAGSSGAAPHFDNVLLGDRLAGKFADGEDPPPGWMRRLMPVEFERLQGFPDGWTDLPDHRRADGTPPSGPRYKAIGNSWPVSVAEWILSRIIAAEGLDPEARS